MHFRPLQDYPVPAGSQLNQRFSDCIDIDDAKSEAELYGIPTVDGIF